MLLLLLLEIELLLLGPLLLPWPAPALAAGVQTHPDQRVGGQEQQSLKIDRGNLHLLLLLLLLL